MKECLVALAWRAGACCGGRGLLGLVQEGGGVGAQLLVRMGADLSRVRQQVLELLAAGPGTAPSPSGGKEQRGPLCSWCRSELDQISGHCRRAKAPATRPHQGGCGGWHAATTPSVCPAASSRPDLRVGTGSTPDNDLWSIVLRH